MRLAVPKDVVVAEFRDALWALQSKSPVATLRDTGFAARPTRGRGCIFQREARFGRARDGKGRAVFTFLASRPERYVVLIAVSEGEGPKARRGKASLVPVLAKSAQVRIEALSE